MKKTKNAMPEKKQAMITRLGGACLIYLYTDLSFDTSLEFEATTSGRQMISNIAQPEAVRV